MFSRGLTFGKKCLKFFLKENCNLGLAKNTVWSSGALSNVNFWKGLHGFYKKNKKERLKISHTFNKQSLGLLLFTTTILLPTNTKNKAKTFKLFTSHSKARYKLVKFDKFLLSLYCIVSHTNSSFNDRRNDLHINTFIENSPTNK